MMKYAKMLALAAVAAGALMAFIGAGTASASVICSTTADPCPSGQAWPNGTVLDFSIQSGAAKLVDTSNNVLDECTSSTVKGKITNTGSSTATVTGTIEELNWAGCTVPTKTIHRGCLEVHKITGTSNGTVTSDACDPETIEGVSRSNTEVTINTIFFGSCIYAVAPGKSIGDISEGSGAGSTFTANAVATKVTGSNFACPETTRWTGTYVLTTPSSTTLSVSASGS
jgi:hypothetical protein